MQVKFRVNLGIIDAKKLNLDHKGCTIGDSLTVNAEVGAALVKRGIVEVVQPTEVKGEAKPAAIAEASDTKTIKPSQK